MHMRLLAYTLLIYCIHYIFWQIILLTNSNLHCLQNALIFYSLSLFRTLDSGARLSWFCCRIWKFSSGRSRSPNPDWPVNSSAAGSAFSRFTLFLIYTINHHYSYRRWFILCDVQYKSLNQISDPSWSVWDIDSLLNTPVCILKDEAIIDIRLHPQTGVVHWRERICCSVEYVLLFSFCVVFRHWAVSSNAAMKLLSTLFTRWQHCMLSASRCLNITVLYRIHLAQLDWTRSAPVEFPWS